MSIEVLAQEMKDFRDYVTLQLTTIQKRQDEIHEQVKKTNGRVTKLEKFVWFGMGIGSTVSIFWTIFTFFAG